MASLDQLTEDRMRLALLALLRHAHPVAAFLFGSHAEGRANVWSDYDLAVFIEGAEDCSVVSAIYSLNDRPIGEIGVIGPTRIPYSKVISILGNVVRELNFILTHCYFDDR